MEMSYEVSLGFSYVCERPHTHRQNYTHTHHNMVTIISMGTGCLGLYFCITHRGF